MCAKVTCVSDKSKAPAKPEKGSRRRRVGVLALVVLGRPLHLHLDVERLDSRRRTRRGRLGEHELPAPAERRRPQRPLRLHRRPGLRGERRRGSPRGSAARAAEAARRPASPPSFAESPTTRSTGRSRGRVCRSSGARRTGRSTPSSSTSSRANTERLQLTKGAVVLNVDQIVADVAGAIGAGEGAARGAPGSDRADHDPEVRSAEHRPEDRQVAEDALVLAARPRASPCGRARCTWRPAAAADDSQHRLEPGDHRAPHPRHPQGRGQCGHRQPRRDGVGESGGERRLDRAYVTARTVGGGRDLRRARDRARDVVLGPRKTRDGGPQMAGARFSRPRADRARDPCRRPA